MPLFITGSRFNFTEGLPSGRNFGLENRLYHASRLKLVGVAVMGRLGIEMGVRQNVREGNAS